MKIMLFKIKQNCLSVVSLCALHDPVVVTLSSPAGYYKDILIHFPTKFGCYNANRIIDKVIIVCYVI